MKKKEMPALYVQEIVGTALILDKVTSVEKRLTNIKLKIKLSELKKSPKPL